MRLMNSIRGLWVCDGCDRAVDEAEIVHIPNPKRVEPVRLAFCSKCGGDSKKKAKVITECTRKLNSQ